jgi:hypothetical protein
MPKDFAKVEQELRLILDEKRRVDEEIAAVQQQMSTADRWLTMNPPATAGYQETLEKLLGLETYLADLYAQAACLDEVTYELRLALEQN